MTRLWPWPVLLLVLGCGDTTEPQSSSGSHWLSCGRDLDCAEHVGASCDGQYCVAADGTRLRADAATTPAMEPVPPAGGASAVEPGVPEACPVLPEPLAEENVFEGTYVITGESSLEGARIFSAITGDLSLGQRSVLDVSDISLPGLQRVGGSITALNSTLRLLALPRLESLGGGLELNGNAALQELDLRSVATIAGDVRVNGSPELSRLGLDALTTVGGTVELGPTALAACEVEAVFDAIGTPGPYTGGRNDCACAWTCERWLPDCP